MATFTFEQQRVIIRFLHLCGMKPIEIHQQLSETCNDGVMGVKNVRSWVQQFKGRTSCENKPKEPRLRTSRSEDMIARVVMVAMFWDNEGVILTHCVPKSTTVMGETYEDMLRSFFQHCVKNGPKRLQLCPFITTTLLIGRLVFTSFSTTTTLKLYSRTHIFHVHKAIIACLTQLLMNFDGFHATQVEESDNHALFFECKRRHYQYLKHHCHSTTSQAFNG